MQITIVVAKVAGLPRRDDAVVWAADQHHAAQPQQIVAEARRIVGVRLVVDVRQKGAVAHVQLLLVRIVPVVADGRVLADVRVEQLVGGVRHQAGEDQVQEFGWEQKMYVRLFQSQPHHHHSLPYWPACGELSDTNVCTV